MLFTCIPCFVLNCIKNNNKNSEDYHTMISGGHTTQSNPCESFVKSLIEEGKWSEETWPDFKRDYLRTHRS